MGQARAQAFQRAGRFQETGIRQQQHELLAAEACDRVAGAQGGARHGHDVAQCGVATQMAMRGVDVAEVVQVQQRQAEGLAAAQRTHRFALEQLVEAAPVQRFRQLVHAHQRRDRLQFFLQAGDAPFGGFHLAPRVQQAVARAQGLRLHLRGVVQDVLHPLAQLGDAAAVADGLRMEADAVVELAGAAGHAVQPLHEGHHHLLHRSLGFGQALLQQTLLVDHLAQAGAGLFQRGAVQGAGQQLSHRADLVLQPAAVLDQLTHVLQQQVEQAAHQFLRIVHLVRAQADEAAQFLHVGAQLVQRLRGLPLAHAVGQRMGLRQQGGVVAQQVFDAAGQHVMQQVAQLLGLAGQRLVLDRADVFVDQLPQGAAIAGPVGVGVRRLQALAHALELAGQAGHTVRKGGQQRPRLIRMREQGLQLHAADRRPRAGAARRGEFSRGRRGGPVPTRPKPAQAARNSGVVVGHVSHTSRSHGHGRVPTGHQGMSGYRPQAARVEGTCRTRSAWTPEA